MTIQKDNICCPTCGKKGTWLAENKDKPFCSARCKLIDLGEWASEQHRIAGEEVDLNNLDENDESGK